MNASTVTKTNRAYGLVRRSKPYYHTTGGGGKEEQQQEQEQEQEEGRRRNGPAELRLSKRGQSRQAKCSCRGARPGCRGNTGGGRGREGSAVRCANPRGLHRQVRSRIWESMRVRRCTTGTRRTPQFSTKVEIHGFADVTPNGLYVRHHLPQYFLNGMPIRCGIRFDQCTGFIDWLHSATGQQAQTPPRGLEPHPITCWPVAVVEYRSWPEAVDWLRKAQARFQKTMHKIDVRVTSLQRNSSGLLAAQHQALETQLPTRFSPRPS